METTGLFSVNDPTVWEVMSYLLYWTYKRVY